MAGDDYEMMSTNLTFPSGSMDNATQCFDVMITNDTLVEGDETFIVTMTCSEPLNWGSLVQSTTISYQNHR